MLEMGNLTSTQIEKDKKLRESGRYGDGDGLSLVVKKSGTRSWVVRVQKDGKRRDIGVGSVKKVPLAMARERATKVRLQIEAGLDPVMERKKAVGIPTFREAAVAVYEEQRKTWKNQKHNHQWMQSLEAYAFPSIGDTTVDQLEFPAVRDLLMQHWLEKHETMRRVRQRIGTILDWAVGRGLREYPLPMAIINKSLPKPPRKDNHFAAMPFADISAFLDRMEEKSGMGALALRFTILNASRSGETRLATWSEINFKAATWSIPAERMKAGREHVVPLTEAGIAILKQAKALQVGGDDLIFQGTKKGRPLSDMTLVKILRDSGLPFTVHGFRSSFRDWVAEKTEFAGETAEMALAHTIGNKTEAAYRRGNQLGKRRVLMDAWAAYCVGTAGNVVRLVG